MVSQQRALRTRRALVRAAAEQIDRHGYDGASLQRVSRGAGISMGALTFHFPTKDKLADALQERGRSMTQAAVRQALAVPASPLRRARALVLALARLLEKDTEVRAAARLARERSSTEADWTANWLPHLRELLDQAHADGQLRAEADPETVTVMAGYLIAGVDAHLRHLAHTPAPDAPHTDAVGQLARVWDLILHGVCAVEPPRQNARQGEDVSEF
ncbi:TetR/AcrR family transcriptional regulator [Streptomyces sp. BA2]|uniref:TetR/AcrR family transcriptional regulator n=1 Tax=Streptomyces sp. BA2 TaxID=436595 RepID=UPI00132B1E3C|nr:TetR/AcrR family transcriptional regulator [Streptomyces sp. BA2]MWA08075.1 TetR family transcriptional regulator [Streptomyces sp. BA2]